MKRFVLLLAFVINGVFILYGQNDTLLSAQSIKALNDELATIKDENASLRSSNEALRTKIDAIERDVVAIKKAILENKESVASLQSSVSQNADNINTKAAELDGRIVNAQDSLDAQSKKLRTNTRWGFLIAIFVLCISALITLFLHKKGNNRIEALKQQSDKINEEIVNKFTTEIAEMQKVSSSISALSSAGASSENEQGLIKALADRITFMEMTLFKMDKSVRGYKHLSKSVAQMKDNLLASGYEIVDMLGKEYHDGMKVTANFIEDDTIEAGKQIITGIVKPQINYNGTMIQAAQITVSQNI